MRISDLSSDVCSSDLVASFQKMHDALNFNDGNRVHAGEGFVQENEPWVRCQRPRYFDAAPFAARERNGGVAANMADLQFVDQGFQIGADARRRQRLAVVVELEFEHGAASSEEQTSELPSL